MAFPKRTFGKTLNGPLGLIGFEHLKALIFWAKTRFGAWRENMKQKRIEDCTRISDGGIAGSWDAY